MPVCSVCAFDATVVDVVVLVVVVVLSGLDKPYSRSGDGHYAKTANFLTGLHVRKTVAESLDRRPHGRELVD